MEVTAFSAMTNALRLHGAKGGDGDGAVEGDSCAGTSADILLTSISVCATADDTADNVRTHIYSTGFSLA